MAVKEVSANARPLNRAEQRVADRKQQRADRAQAKNTPAPAPVANDAAKVQVSTQAANTPSPDTAKAAPVQSTPPKSFIGGVAGANVVNIASQGGNGGNTFAIFGSGEGPKAVKPDQTKEKTQTTDTTKTADTSVNTVA